MHRPGMLSIWFFIGALLFIYGLLIVGAGLFVAPSEHPVVRADLHANVWWGALLTVLGAFYAIRFRPGKGN